VASIRREKLEAQEKIKAENRENLRLRGVAKEAEAAYDQVLMLAYAAKLDREAIERENAFQVPLPLLPLPLPVVITPITTHEHSNTYNNT
jgi:hypothetical protein